MIASPVSPSAPRIDARGDAPPTAIPNPVWSTRLARPDHPALIAGGLTWSGEDLADAMLRAAGPMARAGIAPGMRVALCGPPSPAWVIALHALGWLGAVAVPLPPEVHPDELARRLELGGVEQVLLTHGLSRRAHERLCAVAPQARFVTQLPVVPHGPAPAERFWPLDEPRVIVFSSGSSGAPTAVALTTAQLAFSAFGSAIRLGHQPDDRWLVCLPTHHVGGLSILYRCAFYGTSVLLHPRFDARQVARALDGGEASLVSLVPNQLARVLDARPRAPFPPSLRAILLGGDAAPEDLLARCRAIAAPVALTWGMTETASQVATRTPGDLAPLSGVGAPLPFARVESRDGVLSVRGTLAGGRVETRDLGCLDLRGRVHVEGRREDYLVSGGETVALREVEATLAGHPQVAEAAVVGVPDPRWGERPAALVVGVPGGSPDPLALRAWCRERLGPAGTPDRIEACAALPRTSLGKLARGEVRRLLGVRRAEGEAPRGVAPSVPREPLPPEQVSPTLNLLLLAAQRHGAASLQPRLDQVREALGRDLLGLEERLLGLAERLERPPALAARRAARDLLQRPGKRVRPLCALLAARLGGRPLDPAVHAAAAAAELVHTATLLHDDVIDEGEERRGAPAARILYSNSASVLAGDYLFAEALRLVGDIGERDLLDRLLEVIAEMVEAEALQLERRGQLDARRETYLRVIRGKTAALFRWSLWSGGRLAGLDSAACGALARAGDALGMAFQLVDDLLDLRDDRATTGKDGLADLRQGKVTWPLIVALEEDPALGAELSALVAEDAPDAPARLNAALARVRASDARERTRAFAQAEGARAREELSRLPAGWPRGMLEAIVEIVVDRSR